MISSIDDLKETILKLREERYSDIPEGLVENIIDIEIEGVGDNAAAFRGLVNLIEEYLVKEWKPNA